MLHSWHNLACSYMIVWGTLLATSAVVNGSFSTRANCQFELQQGQESNTTFRSTSDEYGELICQPFSQYCIQLSRIMHVTNHTTMACHS